MFMPTSLKYATENSPAQPKTLSLGWDYGFLQGPTGMRRLNLCSPGAAVRRLLQTK